MPTVFFGVSGSRAGQHDVKVSHILGLQFILQKMSFEACQTTHLHYKLPEPASLHPLQAHEHQRLICICPCLDPYSYLCLLSPQQMSICISPGELAHSLPAFARYGAALWQVLDQQVCHRFCKQIDLHDVLFNCFSSQLDFLCMVPQPFLAKHPCAWHLACPCLRASQARRDACIVVGVGHELLVMQASSV